MTPTPFIRPDIEQLPGSRIREVANAAMGCSDVLPFWFGESDEVTPQAVRDAACASLARGETFYAHNLGLPSLREAIAGYMQNLHGPDVGVQRIAVVSSGVTGLMLAMQLLVGAGDEVVRSRRSGRTSPLSRSCWAAWCGACRCRQQTAYGAWTWTNCVGPSRTKPVFCW